jgi:two-component system OmpR family sensor kinase
VTILVALTALLITAATTLATRQLLLGQVDQQLDTVTSRVRDPDGSMSGPGRGPDRGLLRPGQPIGTLAVIFDIDGTPQSSGRLTETHLGGEESFGVAPLSDAAIDGLAGVATDGSKTSVASCRYWPSSAPSWLPALSCCAACAR